MELVKNSPKVSQNSFVFILCKNVSKYFEKHTLGYIFQNGSFFSGLLCDCTENDIDNLR